MEQKRTLWIVTAAGIFLCVVLLTALLLFRKDGNSGCRKTDPNQIVWTTPETQTPAPSVTVPVPDYRAPEYTEQYPSEDSDSAEESPVIPDTLNADNITIYSNGNTTIYGVAPATPEGTADFNSTTAVATEIDVTEKPAESVLTPKNEKTKLSMKESQPVKVPESKVLTEPSYSSAGSAKAESPVEGKETKTAAASVTSKPKTATSGTSKKTATSSGSGSTAAAKATASAPVPDRFWIQTGSYTSKKAADEARAVLDENKFQCEVFTYTDAKGKLYYRVRVGPYTTKSEAEYWKKRIDQIEKFKSAQSYITNSSAKK